MCVFFLASILYFQKVVESEETQEAKKHKTDRKEKSNKKEKKRRDDKQEKSPSPAGKAREAQEAAFTAWKQGDVEVFLADLENQVTNMAGRAGVRYEVQKVQEYAEKILEALRSYGPAVPEVDGAFMDAKEAQALLQDMLRLARAAEAFLTSGTRATAGASAGTWESEHSKEWEASVLCSGWPKWVQFVVSYVWKGPRCSFKASVQSVVQRAVSVLEFPVPLSRKILVLEQHPLQSHLSPVHEWLQARGRARIKRPKF